MLNGVAVLSLLPQNDCHAVVDFAPLRRQLQRVVIVCQCAVRFATILVIIGERRVGVRVGRRAFENGGKVIFRFSLPGDGKIFTVSRAVVEPNVPRKLLVAIHGFADALADVARPEACLECRVDLRRGIGVIKPDQPGVRARPDGRERASAGGYSGERQLTVPARQRDIGGGIPDELGPTTPGHGRQPLRVSRQQQFQVPRHVLAAQPLTREGFRERGEFAVSIPAPSVNVRRARQNVVLSQYLRVNTPVLLQ